jgi:hypothetical protein
MKYLAVIATLMLAAGCCGGPRITEKTAAVIEENVVNWQRVRTYITLTSSDEMVDGKTGKGWLGYSQAALANAFILQAKARGEKLTYSKAYKQAGQVDIP